ncbi:hypothetical protein [Tenacibaculum agarivorans]|uniref:hypothetical protein n=1 Tax=Tenacibaculum agarivorans TaxID=1908389 RepID=UPI00094B80EC|nr:hypothetical protein [Tenacibaculum agarivorans]
MQLKRLLFLCLIFIQSYIFSQACGSGIFTLKIEAESDAIIGYEILQIKQEFKSLDYNDFYHGYIINEKEFNELKVEKFDEKMIPPLLGQIDTIVNNVSNNTINFKTIESGCYVYLIKIKTLSRTIYVLANCFGGCDRKSTLVLSEKEYLIKH